MIEAPPTPAGTKAVWYPAGVVLPDRDSPWNRTKVFVTPDGLYIYSAIPADPDETNGPAPDWYSPINYDLTVRARPTSYAAKNGWDCYTAAGIVVVTHEGGCGCGWPLKRWTPRWARARVAW